jgi:hypothetical protein
LRQHEEENACLKRVVAYLTLDKNILQESSEKRYDADTPPKDNGLCESFNGRLRDECLNTHEFESLEQAKRIIEAWRRDYNDHRLHSSLGKLGGAISAVMRSVEV